MGASLVRFAAATLAVLLAALALTGFTAGVATAGEASAAEAQPAADEHSQRTAADAAVGLVAGVGALATGGALVVAARRRKE